MITKRIIPCLDVKDGRVVKGVNFGGLQDVSSPVTLAEFYSDNGADELVFYDITASSDGRKLFTEILTETARRVFTQIDLIDKFEIYQDSKMIFNFDDVETLDAFIDLQNQQKEFFKNFYIKMNNCNPNPDFWTSERLETYYITSKILPKFIREELHADFSEDNMNMICKLYFQSRDKDCKTIASEQFADTLHRLINDTKLSGSVLEVLGD